MYVKPHMNGLSPDLVLLHPLVGVGVFEIKDWTLDAMDYLLRKHNPIDKIRQYKNGIHNLYCPRLDPNKGQAVITAGLVFTQTPREPVIAKLNPFRDEGMRKYPQYYPICGNDDLNLDSGSSLDRIFPERRRRLSKIMNPDLAEDLRGWLQEPAFAKEQRRRPIPLNDRQNNFVTTRTRRGYRRIRGPAGSGKSVVVACRAAQLAADGSSVLVVCYNITLLNYLRDLAVRAHQPSQVIRRHIEFLNFDEWCRRVCRIYAHDEHRDIWREHYDDQDDDLEPTLDRICGLVQRLYSTTRRGDLPSYDAILVDEGQDFHPNWWQTLRRALKPGGEMMLVADMTQDVYGTASNWTESVMQKSGFVGPWSTLEECYRLPNQIVPLVQRFARDFPITREISLPTRSQTGQTELEVVHCNLRWVHLERQHSWKMVTKVCVDELIRMMKTLPPGTAVADLTFISSRTDLERSVVGQLKDKNVEVRHTFDENRRVSQRQKRALYQGAETIKATTIHSYKGWEGKLLVVFIDSVRYPKDRALLYTAMTRLRKDQQQCSLTVVSTCANLKGFGKQWPEYKEY